MFQSKEHLIRSSDPSLWGFAGLDLNDDDHTHNLSTRLWNALNSKIVNVLIVLLVLIDFFTLISLILIDSEWINDPKWKANTNCTDIGNTTIHESNPTDHLSPTLLRIQHILSYISLTIISLFFFEALLRIYSGKSKLFIHWIDLLDALLVNIVFVLSLVFYFNTSYDTKTGVKQSALLIIVLRLWRVFKIIGSIIEESQQRLLQTLVVCEKEKNHCEHKIDILILKVEDLEHEVAYLKEKLKKTDKDNSAYVQQLLEGKSRKYNAKRTQSSQSYCPCRKDSFKMIGTPQIETEVDSEKSYAQINSTFVDIETQSLASEPDISENIDNVIDLDDFAKNLAQSITTDVMNVVIDKTKYNSIDIIDDCVSETSALTPKLNGMQTQSNNIRNGPSLIPSSSRNSYKKFINNSIIKPSIFNDSDIYSGLYLISDNLNHSKPKQTIQSKTAPNLDSSSAAHQLNDEPDIERIRKVEFNINDRDIPLSSL